MGQTTWKCTKEQPLLIVTVLSACGAPKAQPALPRPTPMAPPPTPCPGLLITPRAASPCPARPWALLIWAHPWAMALPGLVLFLSPERCPVPRLGLPWCPWLVVGQALVWGPALPEGLKEDNEYSHLRHVILLCSLLLLLLLNEQLLLLPAPRCSQFFETSLHLLQHLGSVAHHQLDAVLSRLQQLHCLLVVLPFHALEARSTDLTAKMLLWSRALLFILYMVPWKDCQCFRKFTDHTVFKEPLRQSVEFSKISALLWNALIFKH